MMLTGFGKILILKRAAFGVGAKVKKIVGSLVRSFVHQLL
jgi:hypothetical protein